MDEHDPVELWFEGGMIWSGSEDGARYERLKRQLSLSAGPLSPDIVITKGDLAIAIECKYSLRPDYAVRDGYYQACTYAMELQPQYRATAGIAVVPEEVAAAGWAQDSLTRNTVVAICSPESLWRGVSDFLSTYASIE